MSATTNMQQQIVSSQPLQTDLRRSQGIVITSTSTPALNGTYAVRGLAFEAMQAEIDAILLAGSTPAFVDGTQSVNWPDMSGAGHSFTVAQFHTLANAIGNYNVQLLQYAAGILTSPPANTATIP
jgi:hypothetical protein